MRSQPVLILLSFLMCSSVAGIALAQPSIDPDTDAARHHYQKGKDLYEQSKYDEAVKEFESAQRIKRSAALEYNIARCYDRLDDLDKAIPVYERFLASAPKDPGDAAERLAKLRGRRNETAAEQEKAKADQERERREAADKAFRDKAKAERDRQDHERLEKDKAALEKAEHDRAALDKYQREKAEEEARERAGNGDTQVSLVDGTQPTQRHSKVGPIVIAAAAVAAEGAGAVLLILLKGKYDTLKKSPCGMAGTCATSDWNGSRTQNYLADGLLGLGAVLAVGDIVWVLASRRAPTEAAHASSRPSGFIARSSLHLAPVVAGGPGLTLGGQF